jgi:hypothetical protein
VAEREGIRYAEAVNLCTSFTRGGVRCIRWGKHGARAPLEHVVQLVAPDKHAWKTAKVFWVSLSPEYHEKWPKQPKNYFVVAENMAACESYLQKRYTKIARKWMGTAQYAISLAQKSLSTKATPFPTRKGVNAAKTALSNVKVKSFGGKASWTVLVEDSLSYAAKALKRPDAVQFAMAKAANSIAGMLRKRAGDIIDPSIATPFPEIARHRRTA